MKGLRIETWYRKYGVDVKEKYDMYCHMNKIEGTLKLIRDAFKNQQSPFYSFVVSVDILDNKFNLKSYSRLKIDSDGQGNTIVEYDTMDNKEFYDFKEVFKSESPRKALNYAVKLVESDMKKLYADIQELNGIEVG